MAIRTCMQRPPSNEAILESSPRRDIKDAFAPTCGLWQSKYSPLRIIGEQSAAVKGGTHHAAFTRL